VFSDDGEVRDEATADFLRHFMEEYDAFVQRVLSVTAPGHIGDKLPEIRR
jgi:chromate reductase, NAD(P)H dehydrogenase (quinone)